MAVLCWALLETQDKSVSARGIGTGRLVPIDIQSRRSPWTGFTSAAEIWTVIATLLQAANFFDFFYRSNSQRLAVVKPDRAVGEEEALRLELLLENALSV